MKRKLLMITSLLMFGIASVFSQSEIHLNDASFKKNVWDYSQNSTWKYEGNKPIIIDFYADWCRPCKMIAPHLKAIQAEYGNKLQVYKINTDKNPQLANLFKIRSIPTILFVPANGEYKQIVGYRSKQQFEEIVQTVLKVEK
ncbi:MAG: thioredoxin [Bacteroidetes bacterium]|nr:MAG: thioredoxin [Bacteroidota bacterium]